jgi:hypothetical protein
MPVGASHADHARRLSAEALIEYGSSLVIFAGPGRGQSLGCKPMNALSRPSIFII